MVTKAGELHMIRTIAVLWGWVYKSRDHEGAHIQNKMEDGVDDFKLIIDILEGDEAVEQQFVARANNVSLNC